MTDHRASNHASNRAEEAFHHILKSGRVRSRFSTRSKAWKELHVVHPNVLNEFQKTIQVKIDQYSQYSNFLKHYNLKSETLRNKEFYQEAIVQLPILKRECIALIKRAQSTCSILIDTHRYPTESILLYDRFKDTGVETKDEKKEEKKDEENDKVVTTSKKQIVPFTMNLVRLSLSILDMDSEFDHFSGRTFERTFPGQLVENVFQEYSDQFGACSGLAILFKDRCFHWSDKCELFDAVVIPTTTTTISIPSHNKLVTIRKLAVVSSSSSSSSKQSKPRKLLHTTSHTTSKPTLALSNPFDLLGLD